MKIGLWGIFLACLFLSLSAKEIIYVSWQRDPTTSMIVHRIIDQEEPAPLLFRKKESVGWNESKYEAHSLLGLSPFILETVFLRDLDEETLYEAKFGEKGTPFSFKTAPKTLENSVKMAFGGDHYHDSLKAVEAMNKTVAAQSPLVTVIGGDLAYSFTRSYQAKEDKERWIDWLDLWSKTMVSPEGVKIPMIVAIGNHEVGLPLMIPFLSPPLFFDLFALSPRESYRKIGFGNWLALYLLDTGHAQSISGPQLNWLQKEAKKKSIYQYKIASYHVPAFPSFRRVEGGKSTLIRKNWVPQFDKLGLVFAMEHHDHLYKRTYPLKNGQKDEEGIIYIGAGGWGGANHRSHSERSFLAKSMAVQSAVIVTFSQEKITLRAISVNGDIIDEVSRSY